MSALQGEQQLVCRTLNDNTREFRVVTRSPIASAADAPWILVLVVAGAFWLQNGSLLPLILVTAAFLSVKLNTVTEESILVVKDLGVQVKTSFHFGRVSSRFIDRASIGEIVINEAIHLFQVKFYLCIIVKGQSSTVVLFPNLLPHLPTLLTVYKGTRAALFGIIED